MNDEDIIAGILEREGSTYTDHPQDRGGPTKYGITQATLTSYRGTNVTPEDVKALTEYEARAIYRKRYLSGPGFDRLEPLALRTVMVDFGVNSGPATATRALQKALGVAVDGVCGPDTIQAAAQQDGKRLAVLVCANRIRFLGRLITGDPAQAVFAAGWLNRVADLIQEIA